MNLDTGSIVGDYQIIGVLGEGGMGKVFKVRNTITDRIETMKVLLPDLAGGPDLAERFQQEIKVLAGLDHPNIAALHTAVRFENQLLMIMELVEGVSLDQRLRQGPLPVAEAVGCISQVLSALACAHKNGVIHRDIKPANMMETPDGTVKLMDFGIAKSENRNITQTGTTMGSLYYMSPEQIAGVSKLDARSDLYSVGVSLYELVTGKRPFDGSSQFAIMSAHLQQTPAPPITLDPSLPPALNELILLSINREPDARFQSADAFRNALNSVVKPIESAEPTVAIPPPMDAQAVAAQSSPQGHRALWATAGALCFAGVLGAAIMLWPTKKTVAKSSPIVASAPTTSVAPAPPSQSATPPALTTAEPVRAAPPIDPTRKVMAQMKGPAPPKPEPPAVQPSVSAPASAPAPAVAPPQPAQPSQPDVSARRAELQKTRESLMMLSARANSIHATLDNLQRTQAANGLGLRGDWVQSASLIDSFLRAPAMRSKPATPPQPATSWKRANARSKSWKKH
jgi:serine/threonine-protein kinase